ncbi:MAG TPA: hypothetical protein VGG19_08385 [Tepidisphaeraceae bacterium]
MAIRTKHYQSEWKQNGGLEVGPIGLGDPETHGVDRYDGMMAIRMGIGLTAFGAMFILWGLGAAWAFLIPSSWRLLPRAGMVLCIFSAILQTTALVCVLPPWQRGRGIAPALWTTTIVLIFLILLTWKFGLERRMKLWNKVLVGLGLAAICVSSMFGNQSWVGIALAVFVCASYGGHAIFLFAFRMNLRASSSNRGSWFP